ncbi:MAG TPA: GNAT family protein [Candidatus Limnocylindria bacterium]|jgi:RimJ/RimL family protein N-acetyltransferase
MSNGQPESPQPTHVIRAQRVYLRPAERADLPTFVRWLTDAEVTKHLAIRSPISQAMEEKWFDQMVEKQGKDHYHFVICLIDGDVPIGATDLRDIDLENGNAGFGIVIGEKAEWNKGYGTETLQAISDFGFGQLRLERIYLEVYAPNKAGQRAYQKAGFVEEGTLRSAHFADGKHLDAVIMSLLRDEWLALPRPKSWEHAF